MYAKAFQELESIYEDLESELAKLNVKCQCCGNVVIFQQMECVFIFTI